jgi:RNA polymerase sigma-70 factor (family 1)
MQGTLVTDASLLQLLANGDEDAFQALYDRYWERLYVYVVRKVEFQETAEEIVQDIFIDLWKRRESLLIERLESYLFGAARNRIVDVIRAGMIRRHHEASSGMSRFPGSAHSLDAEEELAYKELCSAIEDGLGLLPEKTGVIFKLNRLDQLSAREISVLLDIPVRTVEYHITQALRVMKIYLQEFLLLAFLFSGACFA